MVVNTSPFDHQHNLFVLYHMLANVCCIYISFKTIYIVSSDSGMTPPASPDPLAKIKYLMTTLHC